MTLTGALAARAVANRVSQSTAIHGWRTLVVDTDDARPDLMFFA